MLISLVASLLISLQDCVADQKIDANPEQKPHHHCALKERTPAAASRSKLKFELARVLVRLHHVACFIVNANHSVM
jgi:hypothetical protein